MTPTLIRTPLPQIGLVLLATVAAVQWRAPEPQPDEPRFVACPLELPSQAERRAISAARDEIRGRFPGPQHADVRARLIAESDAEVRQRIRGQPEQLAGPPPPTPNEAIDRALDAQDSNVHGCFQEWAERGGGDAELRVQLDITAGVGRLVGDTAAGPLPMCVTTAVERVKFPQLPGVIDARIEITWHHGVLAFVTSIVRL